MVLSKVPKCCPFRNDHENWLVPISSFMPTSFHRVSSSPSGNSHWDGMFQSATFLQNILSAPEIYSSSSPLPHFPQNLRLALQQVLKGAPLIANVLASNSCRRRRGRGWRKDLLSYMISPQICFRASLTILLSVT